VPGGVLIDEPKVGLVDQGGRLQRVARTLVAEVGRRPPAQLPVDEGHAATLYFQSVRLPEGFGAFDLYSITRTKLKERREDDDRD
jgi:hypothetical protein